MLIHKITHSIDKISCQTLNLMSQPIKSPKVVTPTNNKKLFQNFGAAQCPLPTWVKTKAEGISRKGADIRL